MMMTDTPNEQEHKRSRRAVYSLPHFTAWREYRKLTMVELAERSGISRGTIWRIEHDKAPVTRRVLERLAIGLDIRPGDLTGEHPPKEK